MEENNFKNFQEIKSVSKNLAYIDEFKAFIKENPEFINIVHQTLKDPVNYKDVKYGDTIENQGVVITKIIESSVPVFKVDKGGESFFIKINNLPNQFVGEKGFDEFISTQEAKEKLKDLPWVEVADYQLGYRDDKYAYYVSKWNNTFYDLTLDMYMQELESDIENKVGNTAEKQLEFKDLESKIKILKDRLGSQGNMSDNYTDMHSHNMSYDLGSKKIYLFDLQKFPVQ